MNYATNEFSFRLPAELHDRTLNIFSLTDFGPSDFCMVINRAVAPPSATLESQADALIAELHQKLSQFQLLAREPFELVEISAIDIRYSHRMKDKLFLQRSVCFLLPEVTAGANWICFTGTFSDKADIAWQQSFEEILYSLEIRKN